MDDFYKDRAEAMMLARDAGETYVQIGRTWGVSATRARQIVETERARARRIRAGKQPQGDCQ